MCVKFLLSAQRIAPTAKKASESINTGLRPKIWLKEAKIGCRTVDVNKNDVPDQNASIALPLSFSAMIGKATDKEVASRAAARLIIIRLKNATRKRQSGLKSSGAMGMSSGYARDVRYAFAFEITWDSRPLRTDGRAVVRVVRKLFAYGEASRISTLGTEGRAVVLMDRKLPGRGEKSRWLDAGPLGNGNIDVRQLSPLPVCETVVRGTSSSENEVRTL